MNPKRDERSREQKIIDAEAKVTGLKLVVDPLLELLKSAEDELHSAKRAYDIGEHVQVEKTCRSGCCIEYSFKGVVTGVTDNGAYTIKTKEGIVHDYVFDHDMHRL